MDRRSIYQNVSSKTIIKILTSLKARRIRPLCTVLLFPGRKKDLLESRPSDVLEDCEIDCIVGCIGAPEEMRSS